MEISSGDKHTITQMTGLSREKLDEVIEAINYVQSPTHAFIGPAKGAFHKEEWLQTEGNKIRKVNDEGWRGKGPKVTKATDIGRL